MQVIPRQTNGFAPGGRYIYNFDGVDDYIRIPQVDLVAGDTVSFKARMNDMGDIGTRIILAGGTEGVAQGFNFGFDLTLNQVFTRDNSYFDATYDGAPVADNHPIALDGQIHEVQLKFLRDTPLNLICRNDRTASNWATPIFDVEINAASGNRFYPIADGWSKNPTITNILDPSGATDGTAFNFEQENWRVVDGL